jgi:hypothetical protein
VIYFVQAGAARGPIKIGYVEASNMMDQRLRVLRTGNAEPLYLIATLPGDLDREREFHKRFGEGRIRGEWFRWDTPGLQELIDEAMEAETLQLVEGLCYCTWCKVSLVFPPRTRVCGEDCERAKKRAAARAWKAAHR